MVKKGRRTREEGSTKFGSCTKCEETNFALDTSEASASPKGLTATLRKQGLLRANTKSDYARSAGELFWNFRVSLVLFLQNVPTWNIKVSIQFSYIHYWHSHKKKYFTFIKAQEPKHFLRRRGNHELLKNPQIFCGINAHLRLNRRHCRMFWLS